VIHSQIEEAISLRRNQPPATVPPVEREISVRVDLGGSQILISFSVRSIIAGEHEAVF